MKNITIQLDEDMIEKLREFARENDQITSVGPSPAKAVKKIVEERLNNNIISDGSVGFSANKDDIQDKLDMILSVLAKQLTNFRDNAEILHVIEPMKERIRKLHDPKYAGKEYHAVDIVGSIGVIDPAQKFQQNQTLWQEYKLKIVEALLKLEGFAQNENQKWRVGV